MDHNASRKQLIPGVSRRRATKRKQATSMNPATLARRQRTQEEQRRKDRAIFLTLPGLGYLRRALVRGEQPIGTRVQRAATEVVVIPVETGIYDENAAVGQCFAVRRVCAQCECEERDQPHKHGPLPCWLQVDKQEGETRGRVLPWPKVVR